MPQGMHPSLLPLICNFLRIMILQTLHAHAFKGKMQRVMNGT
jgi:hypothetical protein